MKYEKVCKVCNLSKLIDNFPYRGKYRLKSCSDCYLEAQRILWRKRYYGEPEYKRQQIEKMRRIQWKSRYGVAYEEVYMTLDEQGGKCANLACQTEISLDPFEPTNKRANIDHDHKTGQFRALLCNSCNTLLGRLEKSKERIDGLIDYANRFSN